jgi:hypothetical protein
VSDVLASLREEMTRKEKNLQFLKKMTRQELFTKAYNGLKKQNFVRSVSGDSCKYRHPDGLLRCVIGHIIPDDLYNESFEGQPVVRFPEIINRIDEIDIYVYASSLDDVYVHVSSLFNETDLEFLSALQLCHDCSTSETLKSNLARFAEKWNVKIPE